MATPAERVRALLGETIEVGGVDSDTMFTDAEILDILAVAADDVELAVVEGWRRKAAAYANLVDTSEGTSKRAMSDLHKNALRMVESLTDTSSSGSVAGRTRSRQIVRP